MVPTNKNYKKINQIDLVKKSKEDFKKIKSLSKIKKESMTELF